MTSASVSQRAAVMPTAAFVVAAPAMRKRCGGHGPAFAITYEWDGALTGGNGLTATHSPRPLGRLST
jgi:hypothetical protein